MYIIIVGCGRIGSYLAKLLQDDHNIVTIDADEKAITKLGEDFNGLFINGDGLDPDVLKDAGVEKADALAVTTSNDNTNIVIAQIAKKIFNVPKVIARVSDVGKSEIYSNMGVDPVNSTSIFSTLLREKIIARNFSTHIFESDKVTLIEIKNPQFFNGKAVEEINLPREFQVIAIIRRRETIIPDAKSILEENDVIVGIVKITSLKRVKRFLKIY